MSELERQGQKQAIAGLFHCVSSAVLMCLAFGVLPGLAVWFTVVWLANKIEPQRRMDWAWDEKASKWYLK